MGDPAGNHEVLDALRAGVSGPVLTPAEDGYAAEVACSDLSLRHTPPIAVGAAAAADVAATVRIAVAAGLPIAVVGTGHADTPPVRDGVLLSTRRLDDVRLDDAARTATVGAGATWHDVMDVTTPAGLSPLCGSAPGVGVAGFLLGGGLGPIARTSGFSCDHVREFRIVCADGELRTASADEHPDLYRALRGGKGGFGIVTEATVELLDLPFIYGGGEYYPASDIPSLLNAYQGFAASGVPNELTTSLAIMRMPDLPALPAPLRGQTVVHLRVAYAAGGDPAAAEAERLLQPLRAAASSPVFGTVGRLAYADIGTIHNDPTTPSAVRTGGMLLDRLEPETVEAILAVAGPQVSAPLSLVELRHLGGAVARPGSPPDAVSGRDAAFGLWVAGAPMAADADPAALAPTGVAVRAVLDAVAPWSTGGVQINFCGSVNTAAEAARAWPAEIADELAAIRLRYDPDGVFPYVPGAVLEGGGST